MVSHRRYSSNPYKRRDYITSCDSHPIFTTVTSTPSVVRAWLFRTRRYHTHRLRRSCLLVGLGVQWTPSFRPGYQNQPATLQLCVGHHCLIFQLSHAPRVPLSLRRFLSDPNITFAGLSNKRDNHLLQSSDHNLSVSGLIDLVDVASARRGYSKVISMETLADRELGFEGVRKDPVVGRSNWDAFWLSDDQVEYASVDAFVSFLLGKTFRAWKWEESDDGGDDCGDYDDDDGDYSED